MLNSAFNKIQGDWDETKRASLMAEFDASALDVSMTGFDADEVDAPLNKFSSHEAVEDDFDEGTAKKAIADAGGPEAQPGDMWLLGDTCAGCAVTSPPADPKEYAKEWIDP